LLCHLLLLPTASGGADISGLLRVGIFSTHPLNFVDKDGSAEGINPDLLRAIFADEKVPLAFVPGSWAEGLKRLEDGEIDMMMSVAHSEERAKVMDFGRELVLPLWGRVFTRPELPIILCSGYSSIIDRDKAIALGIREFVVKPLLNRDLALLLRQVIATVEEKE
jgi:ABC-type amino acid transport substrate-binding protein